MNRALAVRIVVFSSLVAVLTTLAQLWSDYRSNVGQLTDQQSYIATSYVDTLEASVWTLNQDLIGSQVQGIARLPGISFVQVRARAGQEWRAGELSKKDVIETHIELKHSYLDNQAVVVGTLVLQSDLWPVYKSLAAKAAEILVFNALKTFCVAAFILLLVRRLITDPLARIAEHFDGRPQEPLRLARHPEGKVDEIDQMAAQLNNSYGRLAQANLSLLESERQLAAALTDRERLLRLETGFKEALEIKVSERTRELEDTVTQLKETQTVLIERERLASLGRMVAGLAHEINTPLGVSLTVTSALDRQRDVLRGKIAAGELKRSELDQFVRDLDEGGTLLNASLSRTADLVGNFKRVAVDHGSAQRQRFELGKTLAELIETLRPMLVAGHHELVLNCPEGLYLESYPNSLGQVLTNLVSNAVTHGFQDKKHGRIEIRVEAQGADRVEFFFADDGRGIEPGLLRHIFDPFVSARRGRAGAGLGLHIVHNIVTGLLGGTVSAHSTPGQGTVFMIRIRTHPEPLGELAEHGIA
ncbi:MAG TPA: ATP-binding protein [Burkholderiaceae bacterium]